MYNNNMMNNNNNNHIEIQRQESLKRRWHDSFYTRLLSNSNSNSNSNTNSTNPTTSATTSSQSGKPPQRMFHHPVGRLEGGDLMMMNNNNVVASSVTVVLEGRTICHRINLQNHANYQSLAKALRQMFVEIANIQQNDNNDEKQQQQQQQQQQQLDLSNAVPGYIVAYEDLENDLLLAGDLQWKDFVRVAKRIRIMPVKSSSRKQRSTKH